MKKTLFLFLAFVLLVIACAQNYSDWNTKRYFQRATAERVKEYLEAGANLNARDKDGWTPLDFVMRYNPNPEVIAVLLKAGADPNNGKYSPLHHVGNKNSEEIIFLLLSAGSDPNAQNSIGATPLHYAASNKSPEVLTMLLKAGSDSNARDEDGSTPLHSAASWNTDPEVLKVLLKAGAEVNAKMKGKYEEGYTPLHRAAYYNKNSAEVISVLLKAGAEINAQGEDGSIPLHQAARRYRPLSPLVTGFKPPPPAEQSNTSPEVLTLLLEAGSDIHARTEHGNTPLHLAVISNTDPKVIALLLEAGAEINAQDKNGNTPLHRAVSSNENPEVISVLLEAGADSKVKNKDGKTAWNYIQHNRALRNTDVYRQIKGLR